MGLDIEKVNRKSKKRATVASYMTDPVWREWLQTNRIELNAMSTPVFLAWLDAKMAPYAGKLIPPVGVLRDRLNAEVENRLRESIIADILAQADLEGLVERATLRSQPAIISVMGTILEEVDTHLKSNPQDLWSAPILRMADAVASGGMSRLAA